MKSDPGYDASHVIVSSVSTGRMAHFGPADYVPVLDELLARVGTVPGVDSGRLAAARCSPAKKWVVR